MTDRLETRDRDPKQERDRGRYLEERRTLEAGDIDDRLRLAGNAATHPEVLYYLAEDAHASVRRTVAANDATPRQADELLTGDADDEVRIELARKISRLVPGLSERESARLRERTLKVLERLAEDTLPRVRAIVAEEIKRSSEVPSAIVRQLARDVEDEVCCPILEYSPLLGDDDLREIIAAGLTESALVAIARREHVSEAVSDDIAATLEIPAVAQLLANPNAQIREETLDRIIEQAREVEALHTPLAMRPQLSMRAMTRIAGFVASKLVHKMLERNPVEDAAAETILERVRERLAKEGLEEDGTDEAHLAEQARQLHRRGKLDDEFVAEQIEAGGRPLLVECLAVMAELAPGTVRKILGSKSGRAVTALAWHAGLSMRTAFKMQTELAIVSPSQLVPARNGVDYPMDESELVWQLSYFTD